MLSEPKTLDPRQRDAARNRDADQDSSGRDPSADFIQEMAESGTASELGTVKAAADAAEKQEAQEPRKDRDEKA